jgi:hypothetical protein
MYSQVKLFTFCDNLEIKMLLDSLEIDKTYAVTFDLILSRDSYNEYDPTISLSKPILIYKNSNP